MLETAHQQRLVASNNVANDLHASIKDLQDVEIREIIGAFAQMHVRLVSLPIRVRLICEVDMEIAAINQQSGR